jgi:hypothetical protein
MLARRRLARPEAGAFPIVLPARSINQGQLYPSLQIISRILLT